LPALADPIDRAFDLAGAGHDRGEAVSHRHPRSSWQCTEADPLDAAHVLAQVAEQLAEFVGTV
jgi:hypothetical protein